MIKKLPETKTFIAKVGKHSAEDFRMRHCVEIDGGDELSLLVDAFNGSHSHVQDEGIHSSRVVLEADILGDLENSNTNNYIWLQTLKSPVSVSRTSELLPSFRKWSIC